MSENKLLETSWKLIFAPFITRSTLQESVDAQPWDQGQKVAQSICRCIQGTCASGRHKENRNLFYEGSMRTIIESNYSFLLSFSSQYEKLALHNRRRKPTWNVSSSLWWRTFSVESREFIFQNFSICNFVFVSFCIHLKNLMKWEVNGSLLK